MEKVIRNKERDRKKAERRQNMQLLDPIESEVLRASVVKERSYPPSTALKAFFGIGQLRLHAF